jgi:hypothetical protein
MVCSLCILLVQFATKLSQGLHPEEAVTYLETKLLDHQSSSRTLYAITGTGHHSKNGKDKVGKAVRGFLNEWRYVFREFSVPGDRNNVGGILGIDPSSWDRSLGERNGASSSASAVIAMVKSEESGEKEKAGAATNPSPEPEKKQMRILKKEDVETGTVEIPKGPKKATVGS